MFLVSLRVLRQHGARVAKPAMHADGYLVTERRGTVLGLSLLSGLGSGVCLAGPLFDARVTKATADGFVLLGFERDGDAAFVQEWSVGLPRRTIDNGWRDEVPLGPG